MAGRVNIGDVNRTYLTTESFYLEFGNIPGVGQDITLGFKLQQFTKPTLSNDSFDVMVHGHTIPQRGKKTGGLTISATYLEDTNGATYKTLATWHEYTVGSISGNSTGDYKVDAQLTVYDPFGNIVETNIIYGLFIQSIADVSFTGESSTPILIPITFKYTYIKPSTVNLA